MAKTTDVPKIFKQDVAISLANALMRLGKNDYEGVRHHIESARRNLEDWLLVRPEKERPVPSADSTSVISGEKEKSVAALPGKGGGVKVL